MQNYQTTLLLILALVHMLVANELVGPDSEEDLELQGFELFDGDILIDKNSSTINGVQNVKRWPGGRVKYEIKPGFDSKTLAIIKKAMDEFHKKTCIRFEEKKSGDKDYVLISKGKGCLSSVGRIGKKQPLVLADFCFNHPSVVHELNHAVGFSHEQNRNDRDKYLIIHWDAIEKKNRKNFQKFKNQQMFGDFDFNSVMLYGETHGAESGKKSMSSKDPNRKLDGPENKPGLSDSDVEKIKKLYDCK